MLETLVLKFRTGSDKQNACNSDEQPKSLLQVFFMTNGACATVTMKYFSHLNTAVQALDAYDGMVPFHHYIREFLKLDKKYGSKDRKNISRLCYAGLRLGNAFKGWTAENRIRAGLFLCTPASDAVTEQLIGDYNEVITGTLQEKWKLIAGAYAAENAGEAKTGSDNETLPPVPAAIFPLPVSVFSPSLDQEAFLFSFFIQPDLFLRIRPGKKDEVLKQLNSAGLEYELLAPAAVRLPINTKLDELFEQDRGVVVQDYSSQRTAAMMEMVKEKLSEAEEQDDGGIRAWDACAASGGKSILLHDVFDDLRLTVTDIRPTIIHNLTRRFQYAGVKNYQSFVADLSKRYDLPFRELQHLVVADVPCSGSGTWSRTPEQLLLFKPVALETYQQLQQQILLKILPMIKPGGYLLYITCSVFEKENEENSRFILATDGMQLIKQELITGYSEKADTMFTALFQRTV